MRLFEMQLPSLMVETPDLCRRKCLGGIIACSLEIGTDIMRVVGSGIISVSVAFLLLSKVPRLLLHVWPSTGVWGHQSRPWWDKSTGVYGRDKSVENFYLSYLEVWMKSMRDEYLSQKTS